MWRIRECSETDFEPVFSLLHQLWPAKTLDRIALRAVFLRALASDAHLYLCVEEEGRIVGFCSLGVRSNLWAAGAVAHVDELVVDASCRGRGIGKALLKRMIETAAGRGCSRIELDSAFHRTEAHGFFRSQGFENRAWLFTQVL
jgi:ribosomal protein S18 acetylase RimI-like enzyme